MCLCGFATLGLLIVEGSIPSGITYWESPFSIFVDSLVIKPFRIALNCNLAIGVSHSTEFAVSSFWTSLPIKLKIPRCSKR